MFHSTEEPLLEEYVTAKHVFNLSTVDLCEVAANSVRQSSFIPLGRSSNSEARMLGLNNDWDMDPEFSNIPLRRLYYRQTQLAAEIKFLQFGAEHVQVLRPPETDFNWMNASLS
eukprot:TRINITY_DN17658_c0_g1_i2.p1 TRINITY_DN17658_c0_g1~~TRINITY_DN17658_c0_g1_i2.p1  ORF type:complete len:114 (+),score=21.95 TRINITY_DN17658_c0_g1_i2:147-488(+)